MSRPHRTFPFCAIVGQTTLKTALLINAVDPRVGGVLVRGEKGTAKSTAVRALAEVLPAIDVVEACRFSCDPADPGSWCSECRERRGSGPLPKSSRPPRVVELPVSATEDRLVGTLDLEHALKHGERRFEAGLLADANRGILYVDEVNLLDDHLVDTLLDSAAMGVNTVEREGIAFSHPARFVLVGTMNPEEGEVRPQLLDRFGLCVEVGGLREPADRVEVLRRRSTFEDDPDGFAKTWKAEQESLHTRLKSARARVPSTRLPDDLLYVIASICADAGVDGHRADLVLARGATALAAFEGRAEVLPDDIRVVAPLVLAHRLRRRPFEEVAYDASRLDELLRAVPPSAEGAASAEPKAGEGTGDAVHATVMLTPAQPAAESTAPAVSASLDAPADAMRRSTAGRRQETRSDDRRGRYTHAEPPRPGAQPDLALDATLRAAAPRQAARAAGAPLEVRPEDVRSKVRTRKVGASVVFCVDASGSMGAATRMSATKTAVMELLAEAYKRRDRVGLVSFRGESAEVLLAPTASVELAQLKLRSMPVGGATPLAHGIRASLEVLAVESRRDRSVVPWLVLLTDGRANVGVDGGLGSEDARRWAVRVRDAGVHALVIDCGAGSGGSARELARHAGADFVRLPSLEGPAVAGEVRRRLGGEHSA